MHSPRKVYREREGEERRGRAMDMDVGGVVLENLVELITALEQATRGAKQIPTATAAADAAQLHGIYSSLHSAQLRLSSFLSRPLPPPAASADMEDDNDDDSLMQVEDNSTMEEVEERMRDALFIRNKRPKRPLSPSAAAEHHQSDDYELRAAAGYDPLRTKQRALDLVFQFHG